MARRSTWPSPVRSASRCRRSSATSRSTVGDTWSKYCMRTSRSSPSAVARPPRTAVAARVRGRGGVHVARHRGHLVLGEHAGRCGGSRRVARKSPISSSGRRRPRSCGRARAARRRRRPRSIAPGVCGARRVERAAQQQPPVEQRVEAPDGLVERAVGLHADHGHLVVRPGRSSCAAVRAQHRAVRRRRDRRDAHDAVVDRERPRVTVDVDDQRSRARTPPPRPRAGRCSRSNAAGSTSPKQLAGSTASTSPSTRVRSSTDMRCSPRSRCELCVVRAWRAADPRTPGTSASPRGSRRATAAAPPPPTVGPIPAASGAQRVEVEPVERGGVAAQHHLHLDRIDLGEAQPDRLPRERVARLLVRVVAPPHDPVEADLLADRHLRRSHEARTDVALAGPVLARLQRHLLDDAAGPTRAPASRPC